MPCSGKGRQDHELHRIDVVTDGEIDRCIYRAGRIAVISENEHAMDADAMPPDRGDRFFNIRPGLGFVHRGQGFVIYGFETDEEDAAPCRFHKVKQFGIVCDIGPDLCRPVDIEFRFDEQCTELSDPFTLSGEIIVVKEKESVREE